MLDYYPRLYEISVNSIKPYISTGASSVLIDPIDDDIIRRVEDKRRNDIITQEYVDTSALKLKKYLRDYLIAAKVDINNIDSYEAKFGDFWDYQIEFYRMEKADKKTEKTVESYNFDEDAIIILTEFFKENNKKEDWTTFLNLIPNGLIKQPLNELFTLLSRIILGDEDEIKDEIKGERLILNKTQQDKWKKDIVNYLYSFDDIKELNKGNFYKNEILKSGTFLKTLFNINETGIGRGEMMLCYMFEKSKASGGGLSYDVILLNGITYEVKEYIGDKGGIRLGTEGKLTRYKFWRYIQSSVYDAEEIFNEYNKKLKDNLKPFFYKIWSYVADNKQKEGSYNKAISAGVSAGELSDANLNILKMWYYLAHELLKFGHKYIDLPEDIYNRLSKMVYVNNPEQLEESLETAAEQYFSQNPELDEFIVFRPDKINIVKSKGFSFKTITQAAVKFLETELSNKDINLAKTAFGKWKNEIEKTIKDFEEIEDKNAMEDVLKGLSYLDFYYKEQEEEYEKKYSKKQKAKYKKSLLKWKSLQKTLEKNLKKMKNLEAKKRKKAKWIKKYPKPVLKESFYPQLFT